MVRKIFCILLLFAVPLSLAAQPDIRAEISSFSTLGWHDEDGWDFSAAAAGELDISSPARGPVQGRLQLRMAAPIERLVKELLLEIEKDLSSGDSSLTGTVSWEALLQTPVFQLPRAHVRFRFPVSDEYSFRITAGIDRVTWGLGSVLKAGDLIFGADITEGHPGLARFDEVRDETAMLFAGYFPIGDVSYAETVILPKEGAAPHAGARVHSVHGPVSVESAYFYQHESPDYPHNFALSLQGNMFGTDIYGGASLKDDFSQWEGIRDRLEISAGAFRSFRIGYDTTLTARAEGLYNPGEELLLLYGDVGLSPSRVLQLFMRALVQPLDGADTTLAAGASWNMFQGFDVQGVLTGELDSGGLQQTALSAGFVFRF